MNSTFTNWNAMSDKALAMHIGRFIKEKRIEHNKTQESIAHAAGISRSTLSLLEKGETVTVSTLLQVMRVLDLLPILDAFTIRPTISPIQLAKMEMKTRKRVRGMQTPPNTQSTW